LENIAAPHTSSAANMTLIAVAVVTGLTLVPVAIIAIAVVISLARKKGLSPMIGMFQHPASRD
jgi:hypothetical protein